MHSQTEVPQSVINYIKDCTATFGKAKLVLKNNNFFIESKYPDVLRELLRNPKIRAAVAQPSTSSASSNAVVNNAGQVKSSMSTSVSSTVASSVRVGDGSSASSAIDVEFVQSIAPVEDRRNIALAKLDDADGDNGFDDNDDDDSDGGGDEGEGGGGGGRDVGSDRQERGGALTASFMIAPNQVQQVKRVAKEESHYPLLEEYDFRNDTKNPRLAIEIKATTQIRAYQERALNKMFGNGRARSGIIVLPCGAGKSLTGITAATTIKRSVVVMCINNESVKQWKEQFEMWTTVSSSSIKMFNKGNKDQLPPPSQACILLTTYSMACGGRSESSRMVLEQVKNREWGIIILDEVHVAPAEEFRKVLDLINAHCKLGLTATLVREDEKITDLHFLVGPKLYEANWIDLTNQGYLARAQCVEVWCPMTEEFYREHVSLSSRREDSHSRTQKLLYIMNPNKLRVCEYLVNEHRKLGHKIIIFSDDIPALKLYCISLMVPYIYGALNPQERQQYLSKFKYSQDPNDAVIGLSKVGDTALDIPEANVVIQVSSFFGSKRQEAQRLGRILRPKPNPTGGYNAFFYTLVSTDTKEMLFATKRQQYLIDQGYTFKVEQFLSDIAAQKSTILPPHDKKKEIDLLAGLLDLDCKEDDVMEENVLLKRAGGDGDSDSDGEGGGRGRGRGRGRGSSPPPTGLEVRRKTVGMASLSGAPPGGVRYMEYDVDDQDRSYLY